MLLVRCFVFFFKLKTAYEMRISDWSSDVCSSDLESGEPERPQEGEEHRQQLGLGRGPCHAEKLRTDLAELPVAPGLRPLVAELRPERSDERRGGKQCVSTCRYRWPPYHQKKNIHPELTQKSTNVTHY